MSKALISHYRVELGANEYSDPRFSYQSLKLLELVANLVNHETEKPSPVHL